MKAWRFYGFNDMRLDDIPPPVCRPGHVLVEPLCVQPSVTEAQLAKGIPTLAYDRVKRDSKPRRQCNCSVTSSAHGSSKSARASAGFRWATASQRGPSLPCGECPLCLSERSNLCRRGR